MEMPLVFDRNDFLPRKIRDESGVVLTQDDSMDLCEVSRKFPPRRSDHMIPVVPGVRSRAVTVSPRNLS